MWSYSAHSILQSLCLNHLPRVQFIPVDCQEIRIPKPRRTESSVHCIKASIHHGNSVSPMCSFSLLLSSDYNLLINNTLMIFFHAYLFPQSLTSFPEAIKNTYKNLYKHISVLKWSLTTCKCTMTSTKNQSLFGTWDLLLAMKMGVAEIAPRKDPPNP